ncbi:MAG: esterase/lipase [Maribacter sp.]|jgi:esterase/lipase
MKLKKRFIIPIIILIVFLLGPRLKFEPFDGKMPDLKLNISNVEAYVNDKESKVVGLKPDNEARIIWADSTHTKTEYVVLYLHGYSASPMEGDGIHTHFAERYGCNMYLARLAEHGIKADEAMLELTPKGLIESAKEAIAIAQTLGEKVVILSASTGSTLGNYLAAENPGLIHGHLMYSPNFKMVDQSSQILRFPWGLQIARKIIGSKYRVGRFNEQDSIHWTFKQRLEGVGALVTLVNKAANKKIYQKVKTPYMIGYYYKNDKEKDGAVSISEMKKFHELTATPTEQKRCIAFPECGDHCMVSTLRSKDLEGIRKESYAFAEEVLGMKMK